MDWAEYSGRMFEKYIIAGKPYQAAFEMTPFCNFKCNMCYVRLDPEQAKKQGKVLSTEQWLRIAAEAKKMGTVILEVTGGEAVTRPDFPVLYEAFVKMGFIIHLRSNGYLIRNDILDLLKKYKPRRISVTMYGASDETYKKVCDIPDGFSVVSRNVLAMRDAGLAVRLVMTITNDNVDDMILLKRWAKDHDMSIEPFGGLFTPVRGARRSIEHLQIPITDEKYEVSEEELQSVQREIEDRDSMLNPFWMCRGFGAKCCISWDGHMTICNTFTPVWSDPVRDGFEKAYHNLYEDLKKLRRPQECNSCQYIDFCGACPSQLYSATGDPEHTCESICRLPRMRFVKRFIRNEDNADIITDKCEEGEDFR